MMSNWVCSVFIIDSFMKIDEKSEMCPNAVIAATFQASVFHLQSYALL